MQIAGVLENTRRPGVGLSSHSNLLCRVCSPAPWAMLRGQSFNIKYCLKENFPSWVVVGHALIPALEGRGRWISEFKTSLVYRVSSSTAKATQTNLVSKKKEKVRNKKEKVMRKKENMNKILSSGFCLYTFWSFISNWKVFVATNT